VTDPKSYRIVAGLRIPLPLVGRIIPAIKARYPEATDGITDPEEAVRAALKAWIAESLAGYEEAKAKAPLTMTIAQTISAFEDKGKQAKDSALLDAQSITDDLPDVPSAP
jgi:hypothetical protein